MGNLRTPRPRDAQDSPRHSSAPPAEARSPWVKLRSASAHPFLFKRMIDTADPAARPGDLVTIYDKAGRLFGSGLYNPRSQIALRVLTHGPELIDEAWWRGRLARAVELRQQLGLQRETDAYRLVHSEGDGLSGLVAERYADCLVFEMFSLGMMRRSEMLGRLLAEVLGPPTRLDAPEGAAAAWRVVVRVDDRARVLEGMDGEPGRPPPLKGGEREPANSGRATERGRPRVIVREHGVRYRVDVEAGHKTGFFCDQRDNRRRFAALCSEATVLDLCSYTGAFGLCAKLLGKARAVTSVELDEAAVAVARENVNLNQARIDLVQSDAFAYMRLMQSQQRRYDCVVLDPPKLALAREEVDESLRKYHDLNTLAMTLVRPGGLLLTCSCSGLVSWDMFTTAVHSAARRAGRALQLFDQTGAAADHPILLDCPESAYLKALWLRVL